ncbi:MAG: DNA gyrase subunit A [Alphaproteobacteria bacterium MarineAlpha9_Bin3]|nr:MAG: DNA gyrase subunit A [Alphaproteobacteria bacterium MarineAlpha9_Bin3]
MAEPEDPDFPDEENNKDSSDPLEEGILPVTISDEMRKSYLDYAMSVIVSRALPDVRDGLKPVHRRILYAMKEGNYHWNRPYRKSARVVGDVMGKYHPHGDNAIYDAMVRMAQSFSMSLKLLDGQGNFGSMDGDPPAAMRYTEVRMDQASTMLIDDIDKNTIDFQDNYDNSTQEPSVLPAKYPNLLVNGAGGIAVGMATNIPPHNLGEVIDACLAVIENPNIESEELLSIIPGPDFPTGAQIIGKTGIKSAFETGRGSVVMRGKTSIENVRKDREAIIVSEVPYQVNKARMIEQIAEAVKNKNIEGISDLRDESDRVGVRVVIELKRDATPEVVLNQIYKHSPLQTYFGVNMLALNGGRPEQLSTRQILDSFLVFREEVITRRTVYDLEKARDRANILVGLALAVSNIDEVIKLIKSSKDSDEAKKLLLEKEWRASDISDLIDMIGDPNDKADENGMYKLSNNQAKAILELRLQRLTGLERDKIVEELKEIVSKVVELLSILRSREKLMNIMKDEFNTIKEQFAVPRRTEILDIEINQDVESLIEREDMVVTLTNSGYIKRTTLSTYRAQKRGGKGRAAMSVKDEDFVNQVFVLNTHDPVLFFTNTGIVYELKVYKLPLGNPQAKGRPIVNLLPLSEGERVTTMMPLPENEENPPDLMFATMSGNVRRNALSDFSNVKANGKIAMKLLDGDSLIGVVPCRQDDDIILSASHGKCMRFRSGDVRLFKGRGSVGVRGIRLKNNDEVISISVLKHIEAETELKVIYLKAAAAKRREDSQDLLDDKIFNSMYNNDQFILTISENGFGKRTSAYEYRITNRGGQGIINIETSARNGNVVASFPVLDSDDVMMVTNKGRIIRSPVNDIRIASRNTQGVTLFSIDEGEKVVSVTIISMDEEVSSNDDAEIISENIEKDNE